MNSFRYCKAGKGKKTDPRRSVFYVTEKFPIEQSKPDDFTKVVTGKQSTLSKQTKEYDVVHTQTRIEKARGIVRTNKVVLCCEVQNEKPFDASKVCATPAQSKNPNRI